MLADIDWLHLAFNQLESFLSCVRISVFDHTLSVDYTDLSPLPRHHCENAFNMNVLMRNKLLTLCEWEFRIRFACVCRCACVFCLHNWITHVRWDVVDVCVVTFGTSASKLTVEHFSFVPHSTLKLWTKLKNKFLSIIKLSRAEDYLLVTNAWNEINSNWQLICFATKYF